MLGIILLILKIILWLILGILGLILLIILMVLWVPIRYQGMFSKCESMRAKGRISYLFRLVRVVFDFEEGLLKYKVKIAFFTVFEEGYEELPKEDDVGENSLDDSSDLSDLSKSQERLDTNEVAMTAEINEVEKVEVVDVLVEASKEAVVKEVAVKEVAVKETIDQEDKGRLLSNKKKQSRSKKKKVKKKQEKQVENEEESTLDKVKRFYGFLKAYENRGVFKFVFGYVWKMLRSILPKKMEGRLNIGTDDPATTGYILAVVSSLYPLYQEKFVLTPDFDGPRVEGKVKASGRIIIGIIVFYAIRIILDKRVRRLIKEVRK